MAGYRRFIAYVYEYRKGKKEDNCGFMKVEVRNHMCTIEPHLQVEGLAAGEVCKVYGFVRKEGLMNGILLGSCKTEANRIECLVETDGMDMGGSGIPLEKMGGMILLTESGGFFGTEWDDISIRPENFRVVPKQKEDKQGILQTNEIKDNDTEQITRSEIEGNKKNPKKEQGAEISGAGMQKEKSLSADSGTPASQELRTQSVTEQDVQPTQNIETVSPDQEAVNVQEKKSPNRNRKPQEQTNKNFRMFGTPCDVFRDGELHGCHRISPQDLCRMGRRTCLLRNNRFVQYGYYHFGHLLLCQNHCDQTVLGVPGRYDQQERFMANMFGFPYFKESSEIQVPGGKGGYWYRLIDSANPDNRNGC